MLSTKHLRPGLLFIVVLIYVAARLWRLDASCLWFDEIFSVHAAEHTWGGMLNFIALDLVHPPLFYLLLKGWIAAGGDSVYWLRFLPLIFGCIATIPLWLFIVETSFDKWAGLIAMFLLAVNGSLIKYSQEVRMYSLLFLLSTTSMWLFARYYLRGQGWTLLVIVNILLVYTHYFGWLVIGCELITVVTFARGRWRPTLGMAGIVLLAFLPWLGMLVRTASAEGAIAQNIGWMERPGFLDLLRLWLALTEPFHFQTSNVETASVLSASVPLAVIIAAAVAAYAFSGSVDREDRRLRALLVIFATVPILGTFAASWLLDQSVWGTRHLIVVWLPAALLAGLAIKNIAAPRLRTAAVTSVLLFTGYAWIVELRRPQPHYSWCDWNTLVAQTAERPAPIYAVEDLVAYHAWFAARDSSDHPRIARITDLTGIPEDHAYFLPRGFDGVKKIPMQNVKDPVMWILFRDRALNENEPPVRNLTADGYRIVDRKVIEADGEFAIALLMER